MLKINPINNKRYMQLDSFWKDAHNKRMAELGDELLFQRQTLSSIPEVCGKDFFQKTDGTVVYNKSKNPFAFLFPSHYMKEFASDMNAEYNDIKDAMHNVSESARKEISDSMTPSVNTSK